MGRAIYGPLVPVANCGRPDSTPTAAVNQQCRMWKPPPQSKSTASVAKTLREYDDSPWTDDEIDALAAEVDAMLDDDKGIENDE